MKTALIQFQSESLLESLRGGFEDEGFSVSLARTADDMLQSLREAAPTVAITEARRETFSHLLHSMVRLRPETPVYLVDSGAVFGRYPMRSHQPDVVTVLRRSGVSLSDRLLMPTAAAPRPQGNGAFLI